MGALLQFLNVVAAFARTDTSTYADRATQVLVARAMSRHNQQDSTVHDYTASLRYRVSFGLAKRQWADPVPVAVEEQAGRLTWQQPNDLRVDLFGRRTASQVEGVNLSSTFAHPWFVPRELGDSVRIFGASETPARAAPHPFARGAEQYYRYAAGDVIALNTGAGAITIQSITITPKRESGSFVAGRIWVDVATGDVVRFNFRFVGTNLWTVPEGTTAHDSADALRDNRFVSRILEVTAELEYSLQDGTHWMPYREVIAGKISAPLGIDFAVPFEAQTTFDDYVINSGTGVAFDAPFPRDTMTRTRNRGRIFAGGGNRASGERRAPLPDSAAPHGLAIARARGRNRTGYLPGGGRFEIHRAPIDSMMDYRGWGDSLRLSDNPADHARAREAMADLAHITAALPGDMTGRPGVGIAWQHISDILRYNRVEGTALSIGARAPLPITFTDLYATVRYGFADQRVLGGATVQRDAPSGQLLVSGLRDLLDVDAFSSGLTLGNTLDASLTGHDDGAYLLAQGARVSYQASHGRGTDVTARFDAEDEQTVDADARALFPRLSGGSGYFSANPAVRNGFAVGADLRIEHAGVNAHWFLDGGGSTVAGRVAARVTGEARWQGVAGGWLTVGVKAGVAPGSDSVPQLALRVGGINTVRGYDFGTSSGTGLWATQLDVGKPGRSGVHVAGFVDMGEAGELGHWSAPFLAGAGVGISVLGGLIRADLSHPITHASGRGFRLDLTLGSLR